MVLDIIQIKTNVNLEMTCIGNIYNYLHIYYAYKTTLYN